MRHSRVHRRQQQQWRSMVAAHLATRRRLGTRRRWSPLHARGSNPARAVVFERPACELEADPIHTMVDQRLDAMSAKPLQSMEVSALSAAGRFMRLVCSRVTVPKPAAMQEMGHLRTAHGVGPAADRDAGGRWVRIFGGFEGAHGLDGVGGCYSGPGAGWQPFRATSTPTGAATSVRSC